MERAQHPIRLLHDLVTESIVLTNHGRAWSSVVCRGQGAAALALAWCLGMMPAAPL